MRTYIIATILIFACIQLNAKGHNCLNENKYFIINLDDSTYKTTKVELDTKKLYQNNTNTELFNIIPDKQTLILFSVLPSKSADNWSKIDIKKLTNIIDYNKLKRLFEDGFKIYQTSGGKNSDHLKREDIKLIIKKGNEYFVSNNCVAEYFKIITQAMVFPNQMGNIYINTLSPALTVETFEKRYFEIYKENSANAITSANASGSSFLLFASDKPLLFFSGIVNVANKKAYRFWQLSDWRIADGLNSRRGIDRFLFIPEVGIIGGSFDFWFEKQIRNQMVPLKNYFSEEVMMPVSIDGVKIQGTN